MKLKRGVDKVHYSFSTRDVFYDYRKHYRKREYKFDRKTYNRVIDSIIEKIIDEIIYNNQIYRPKGRVGNFQIYKFKPTRHLPGVPRLHLRKAGGGWFYLRWDKPKTSVMRNSSIYTLRTPQTFRDKLREHVIALADDPYARDYSAPLLKTPKK